MPRKYAQDTIYEESMQKYYEQFRSPGNKTVLLNDPARQQAVLVQAVSAASEQNLIIAVSEALRQKKDPEALIHKIENATKELRRIDQLQEQERQAKKAEAEKLRNSQPYRILQDFYAYSTGKEEEMDTYTHLTAAELSQLHAALNTFDVSQTPLPTTYSGILPQLQAWLRNQMVIKNVPAKR